MPAVALAVLMFIFLFLSSKLTTQDFSDTFSAQEAKANGIDYAWNCARHGQTCVRGHDWGNNFGLYRPSGWVEQVNYMAIANQSTMHIICISLKAWCTKFGPIKRWNKNSRWQHLWLKQWQKVHLGKQLLYFWQKSLLTSGMCSVLLTTAPMNIFLSLLVCVFYIGGHETEKWALSNIACVLSWVDRGTIYKSISLLVIHVSLIKLNIGVPVWEPWMLRVKPLTIQHMLPLFCLVPISFSDPPRWILWCGLHHLTHWSCRPENYRVGCWFDWGTNNRWQSVCWSGGPSLSTFPGTCTIWDGHGNRWMLPQRCWFPPCLTGFQKCWSTWFLFCLGCRCVWHKYGTGGWRQPQDGGFIEVLSKFIPDGAQLQFGCASHPGFFSIMVGSRDWRQPQSGGFYGGSL